MNVRSKFSDFDFLTNSAGSSTVIANGSNIEGRITAPGTISVSGYVKGELNASEVVIDREGAVNGSIFAEHLIIIGKFEGEVSANKITVAVKISLTSNMNN